MTMMELFRVLDKNNPIEIVQYSANNNSYFSIQTMPDNIPVHILDCSIDRVIHGKEVTVIELCK